MRLLTGRPHRLLGPVIDEIGALSGRGERCMLLVPSQYTLQAELEVMNRLDVPGSFLIDVLSPTRLQSRVFERAGQPDRVILDERGKGMVLTEVIEAEKENLTVYRAAAESGASGFVQKLSALIADLKRSGMTAQDLGERLPQMEEDSPARSKLADTARLFAAYEARMAGQLADGEDVAQLMRDKLAGSGVLSGTHVFVYGFDMITGTFARDLLAMAACAADLTLAVETDENAAPDGRLFAPVNFSLSRLCSLAQEAGVQVDRVCVESELDAPEDIRMLERSLYALGSAAYPQEPAHISLFAASSPRAEVHRAASQMRRMAMEGADLSGMAVVYPKGSVYAPLLSGILPMYGIPVYVAGRRPANAHPLCRFVLSALRVASEGFITSTVAECVRSGFLPVGEEEADALIAYAEGMDVRGDAWKRPFVYAKEGRADELDALNASREAVVRLLTALGKALARARTADDTVSAVIALLEDVQAFDRLSDMRDKLTQAGLDVQAQDCAQVWNALMETLDQLHTLLGARAVPAKTVLSLLSGGLSALELSALPPADGAVICGEIGNVRTAWVSTLFALGMNDASGAAEEGLLTGSEREEAVRATGAYLGMSVAERAALAQLDELKALSGVRERLVISYALADETGRALREDEAVQALRQRFPKLAVRGGLPQEEMEAMLCAPDAAMEALSVRLSRAADGRDTLDAPYAGAYAALSRDSRYRDALDAVTRGLCEDPARRLTGQKARTLYGRPTMSVSRLETLARCPYQHFVRYGLVPEREVQPGVDRAELGTLYHEAAEQFTRALTALPEFPQVDEATCDALMEQAVSPLIDAWRQSPLGESARGGAIAGRIRRTARRAGRSILSQYAQSRFQPMSFELVFGQNGVAPLTLELADGSRVYLQGRIDRVDVLEEGGTRIRVIDYKSGAKRFDPTMAYWGIQLQLLLYLASALEQIPGASPAGFFYCRIADPTVKSESRIRGEVEQQLAKKLALAGISLSDVAILQAQDDRHAGMITRDGKPSGRYAASMVDEQGMNALVAFARGKAAQLAQTAYDGGIDDVPATLGTFNACTNCDYAAVCGFDPARKARKRLKKKTLADLTGGA